MAAKHINHVGSTSSRILTSTPASAFGLMIASSLGMLGPLLSTNHLATYHSSHPIASILLAAVIEIVLDTVCWCVLLRMTRTRPRLWLFTWVSVLFLSPWLMLKQGAIMGVWIIPVAVNRTILLISIAAATLFLVTWKTSYFSVFLKVQQFTATLLGFMAIYGALLLVELSTSFHHQYLRLPELSSSGHAAVSPALSDAPARVIWIVLDELSYQQVYERRLPGLQLPGFDALAAQSTLFTRVIPAGMETQSVIPSLITGLPVDEIHVSADSLHLSLHNPHTSHWQSFNPGDTIFQDARDAGFSTSVVGWYNPYCLILPRVLDHCFWTSRVAFFQDMSAEASVSQNLRAWISSDITSLRRFFYIDRSVRIPDVDIHIDDYRELVEVGDERLSDPTTGFLFLHLPIPHPASIYNRVSKNFTTPEKRTSYADNLALADRYLVHVHELLAAHNEWDSTALVVMGDHSWRTMIWSGTLYWTPEDVLASHGGIFDDRPAYIVKLPRQADPSRIDIPFQALRTRILLRKILRGQIRSTSDLQAFAEASPRP